MNSLPKYGSVPSTLPQMPQGLPGAAKQVEAVSPPLQLLIAADQPSRVHTLCDLLRQLGFQTKLIYEEGGAIANILSHRNEHCLLVTGGCAERRLIRATRVVERLREIHYPGCIHLRACSLTSQEENIYRAASVDLLPAPLSDSFVNGVNSLMAVAPADKGCLSILQWQS